MKTTSLLSTFAVLSLTLAACSSDTSVPDEPKTPTGQAGYIAIGMRNATGATRGAADYEVGEASDVQMTPANTRFYFFASDGAPYTMVFDSDAATGAAPSNMVQPTEVVPGNTNYGPSGAGQAVLVLGSATEAYRGSIPQDVVVISSPDAGFDFSQYVNVPLDALKAKTTAAGANVISSSTWVQDGKIVTEARIATQNISTTPDGAKENPVIVYVERNKARVRINADKPMTAQFAKTKEGGEPLKIKMGDNTDKYVYIVPTGFTLNAVAPTSYVFKNLDKDLYTPLLGDPSVWNLWGRSFWATTPDVAENGTFTSADFNTSSKDCYENVPNSQGFALNDANTTATKVLVGYKLYLTDDQTAPADLSTPSQLLEWGGIYYTPENMLKFVKEIGSYKNVYMVRGQKDMGQNDYDVYFYTSANEVTDETTPRLKPGEGDTMISINPARFWNGAGYYIVNILHYPTADGSKALYGVIRNHIYDYTFTDFVGLGTPYVTGEVVPENPTSSESYVAAELNVLNWRVMANTTVLQ